jgi:hAT family C-terminal dimerisation region
LFKEATLFFSKDSIETIAHVIPTMDQIDNMLQDSMSEPLMLAVKHVLKFARQIMNKYYSRTDLSNVYRIAMGMFIVSIVSHQLTMLVVLHPQMKLKYFQSHGWKQDWIDTVHDITTEKFAKYNKVSEPQSASASSAADDLMDFGDLPMDNIAEVSKLDMYLAQPVEKVRDAIAWWWDHHVVFPKLSSMALDYLSAPSMCPDS